MIVLRALRSDIIPRTGYRFPYWGKRAKIRDERADVFICGESSV